VHAKFHPNRRDVALTPNKATCKYRLFAARNTASNEEQMLLVDFVVNRSN